MRKSKGTRIDKRVFKGSLHTTTSFICEWEAWCPGHHNVLLLREPGQGREQASNVYLLEDWGATRAMLLGEGTMMSNLAIKKHMRKAPKWKEKKWQGNNRPKTVLVRPEERIPAPQRAKDVGRKNARQSEIFRPL